LLNFGPIITGLEKCYAVQKLTSILTMTWRKHLNTFTVKFLELQFPLFINFISQLARFLNETLLSLIISFRHLNFTFVNCLNIRKTSKTKQIRFLFTKFRRITFLLDMHRLVDLLEKVFDAYLFLYQKFI
jgi:hypothetical protein